MIYYTIVKHIEVLKELCREQSQTYHRILRQTVFSDQQHQHCLPPSEPIFMALHVSASRPFSVYYTYFPIVLVC